MNRIVIAFLALFSALLVKSCSASSPPEWHMVNVNQRGQGDAHLLIDNGFVVLIDSGDKWQAERYLAPYIKAMGITELDFVGSHPHRDHVDGVNSLIDAGIKIKNFYYNMPDDMPDDWDFKRAQFNQTLSRVTSSGGSIKNVSAGFTIKGPTTKFTVIHAQKSRQVAGKNIDTNDYSLIMHWDANNHRVLFTGDLNARLGSELSKKPYVKADIMKCPHHCVEGIAGHDFFDAVSPSMVMIPSTLQLWGHDRGRKAKEWITEKAKYYCNNGLNGNVVLKFKEKIHVKSQRPNDACPNGFIKINPGKKINPTKNQAMPVIIEMLLNS